MLSIQWFKVFGFMHKVLVVGGAGYIGSHMAKLLALKGVEVIKLTSTFAVSIIACVLGIGVAVVMSSKSKSMMPAYQIPQMPSQIPNPTLVR